uniref:Uncharacterized protein n=1 Tax=Anguilla anguilla TaxID=7936 RepID=A0A0E9QB60_ANGAN
MSFTIARAERLACGSFPVLYVRFELAFD